MKDALYDPPKLVVKIKFNVFFLSKIGCQNGVSALYRHNELSLEVVLELFVYRTNVGANAPGIGKL